MTCGWPIPNINICQIIAPAVYAQASTSTAEPGQDAPLAPPERQPAPNAPTPPPGPADLADWQDAPCLLRLKPVPGQRVAPPANPSRIPLNSVHLLTSCRAHIHCVLLWVQKVQQALQGGRVIVRTEDVDAWTTAVLVFLCIQHRNCDSFLPT